MAQRFLTARSTAAALSALERIIMFRIASGAACEAGVPAEAPQRLISRRLVKRDVVGNLALTQRGRSVLAVLRK